MRITARVMAMRWRCPPDKVTPRSPTMVSYPSGMSVMQSYQWKMCTWFVSAGQSPVCISRQHAVFVHCTVGIMRLKQMKRAIAVVWVLLAAVVGVVAGVRSTGGLVALAALGLLPPLALMLLWNEPPETMSESIRGGRR